MYAHNRSGVLGVAMTALVLAACTSPSPNDTSESAEPSTAASNAAPSDAAQELQVTYTGTVPDGWTGADGEVPVPENENVFFEILPQRYVLAADCALEPEPGVGTSAEEIAAAIADREGLDVSEPTEVTVDGLAGLQFDIVTEAESDAMTCVIDDGRRLVPLWVDDLGGYAAVGEGDTSRVIVLDVPGGTNILIWLSASAPEEAADYLDATMQVVNGLEIEVP